MSSVFADYSRYYDLLYADKDYAAEARYVSGRLRDTRPGVRHVVEFGSGTGQHGRLLGRSGFDVTGVERSADMLAQSRILTEKEAAVEPGTFTAIEGDVRATAVPGPCDAVMSLFHVVSYQVGNDDVLAMFRNAARHLTPGGLFLFDVWHAAAVLTQRPETRVKRVGDNATRVTRIAEPQLLAEFNCVDVNFDLFIEDLATGAIRQLQERHRMRYFSTPEIALIAGQTGFEVLGAEEWLTRKEPSTDTWGVCYLLQRSAA